MGLFWQLMNAYVKGAVFIGSLLSQRHPGVDGLLYMHDAAGGFNSALHELGAEGRPPLVIVEGFELIVQMAGCSSCPEANALSSLTCLQTAQQLVNLADAGLVDSIWVLPGEHRPLAPMIALLQKHAGAFRV